MLLTIGLIIAVISTYSEIKLVHGSATLRRIYTHGMWGIDGVYFNTVGSFLLSYLIGMMFGAEGVTVMFGGALSTGLSQMYFSAEGYAQDRGWSWDGAKNKVAEANTKATQAKATTVKVYNDFKQPIQDLGRLIIIVLRIITLPFEVARRISVAYSKQRSS